MSDIQVKKDSKLIKVLASQARGERVDQANVEEASQIITELAQDLTPNNRHQIAQTVAYTVEQLQQKDLDFMNLFADVKNVNYGDKPVFNIKTGGIKAYIQAKGATTKRSMVADRQVSLETVEISARPAINIVDLRTGRVNMADLIREANREISNKKLAMVEKVLQDAISNYSAPSYGTGNGIVKATLDSQIAYFRRLGPVTLLGDQAAVQQLAPLAGMQMDATARYSDSMLNERNENGFLGKYNGCNVVSLANTYFDGTTTPVLATDWIYFLPAGISGDMRNLKVVNEGGLSTVESQNIDDMVFEVRLDTWFGAGFVAGKIPTIGAYQIG